MLTAWWSTRRWPAAFAAGVDFVLTALEKLFDWQWDLLLFLLMFIVLVRPRWKDLRQGRKDYDCGPRRKLDPDHAQYLLERSHADSEHTDGKVKQLLTLSSVLTPIALILAREARPRALALILVSALVAAVLLCVAILAARVHVFPTLEAADQAAEEEEAWAWDLFSSAEANRALHYLRVDIYIAAHRYFVLAFVLVPLLAVFSMAPGRGSAATARDAIAADSLAVRRATGPAPADTTTTRDTLPMRATDSADLRRRAPNAVRTQRP